MTNPRNSPIDFSNIVDLHIHTAPDIQPRYGNDLEIALQAKEAGMRAILMKSHVVPTADRAFIAEKAVGGIRAFGGLVLNASVGGLNPAAVEVALAMGAREIWMPTRSAEYVLRQEGRPGGLTLLDPDGRLFPAVLEIIDLVGKANAILATGHSSPQESKLLVETAYDRGLRKILVTHPESGFIRMPVEMQMAIARPGVFFERCFVDTLPQMAVPVPMTQIVNSIRAVGTGSTVISTDLGQINNPSPVEGMRTYLCNLAEEGFSGPELYRMAAENPAYLLNL